jgi:hypothetical protein
MRMSEQPIEAPDPGIETAPAIENAAPAVPPTSWLHRLGSVLLIIICFELGLFLLVYPWTDSWSDNYFAWALRGSAQINWHAFWDNSYVRGGVSGLGLVNLWIAVAEVFRMFTRRPPTAGN